VIRPEPLDPADPLAAGFLRVLAEVEEAIAERARLAQARSGLDPREHAPLEAPLKKGARPVSAGRARVTAVRPPC